MPAFLGIFHKGTLVPDSFDNVIGTALSAVAAVYAVTAVHASSGLGSGLRIVEAFQNFLKGKQRCLVDTLDGSSRIVAMSFCEPRS